LLEDWKLCGLSEEWLADRPWGDLTVKSTLWHHLPVVGTGAHYTGCPFPAPVVSHTWVCCDGGRKLLVEAMVHSHISINSSHTYVIGGVGTKLDIKCYNDFFLTCVEMIVGPSTLQHFVFSLPFLFWIYSNKVTVVYTLSLIEPNNGTDIWNLHVIYI